MKGTIGLAIALAGAAALLACGGSPAPARPPEPRRLPAPGGLPLLPFRPPADGLLSNRQIDLFLRVRRAAKGRSDADAARAIGASPEEFAWARARILEALVALDGRRVREASQEVYARTLASMREARKRVADPKETRALDEQIATLERERASMRRAEALPPSVARNARLLAGRLAEVETVFP